MQPIMLAMLVVASSLFGNAEPRSHVIEVKKGATEFWWFACYGRGEQTLKGSLKGYDPATGEIAWLITSNDGRRNTASAVISGDKITMFGDSGTISRDRKKFRIETPECPGGFVGQASD